MIQPTTKVFKSRHEIRISRSGSTELLKTTLQTPHWTYLLQSLSKLCFKRVALSGNYEMWLLVMTKTHFLMTFIIKLTLGNIFTKVKNPPIFWVQTATVAQGKNRGFDHS